MNSKLFFTIFLGILAAGVCLYWFIRWREKMEQAQNLIPHLPRREIGFAAILAEDRKA
jgi:hypothetical protein